MKKNVVIVRNRGQITIPDSIRKTVEWVNPMSAVSISVVKPDEIVMKPHKTPENWDEIWKKIEASRAISGRGNESATEFLEKDRRSH
ncbi:MAG: hypothetical protein WD187_02495 [Candidatus Woykebacteria bacterium]